MVDDPNACIRWHEFPDEIKVQVLDFAFALQSPIDATTAKWIIPRLLVSQEFVTLAFQSLYKVNTIAIGGPRGFQCRRRYFPWPFPGISVRQIARSVTLNLLLRISPAVFRGSIGPSDWDSLIALARGELGFQNLKHVCLWVRLRCEVADKEALEQFQQDLCELGVKFEVKVELHVFSYQLDLGYEVRRAREAGLVPPVRTAAPTEADVVRVLQAGFGCTDV